MSRTNAARLPIGLARARACHALRRTLAFAYPPVPSASKSTQPQAQNGNPGEVQTFPLKLLTGYSSSEKN